MTNNSSPLAVVAIRQFRRQTGAVRHVIEQAQCLRRMGFRVIVLAERASPEALAEANCSWRKILRWPIKGLQRRLVFDRLVQYHRRRHQPQLFISHGDARSDDVLFMHNCVHLEAERVPTATGAQSRDARRFHERVLTGQPFRHLVTNSHLMKWDFLDRFRLDSKRVHVFHQGVDTRVFNFSHRETLRAMGRARLGIDSCAPVIGLVTSGNFAKRNVDHFLRVAARLVRQLPTARFLVAGKDARLGEYQRQARELGLETAVLFAPPITDVAQYFHALDLFLYPARLEEYGRVVLEALACGVPSLVSTAVGASEPMVAEGVPECVEGWDEEHWAQRAFEILKNPDHQQRMRTAGLRLSEAYSRERRLQALHELLDRLRSRT